MVTELVVETVDIDIVARHSAGEKVDIAMMAQWWRKCRYCYHCTTLDIDIVAQHSGGENVNIAIMARR